MRALGCYGANVGFMTCNSGAPVVSNPPGEIAGRCAREAGRHEKKRLWFNAACCGRRERNDPFGRIRDLCVTSWFFRGNRSTPAAFLFVRGGDYVIESQ
jgi:hypothetical protein